MPIHDLRAQVPRGERARSVLRLPVVAGALFLAACSGGAPVAPPDAETITLDVRVHLLRSGQSDALTTTLVEREVEQVFSGVNEIWRQAGIEWRVASLVHAEALNPEPFERVRRGEAPPSSTAFAGVIPRGELSRGKWDVFFIRDLGGGVGGIYFPEIPAVLQPETDPTGLRALEGGLARILAHELGHSLSLPHVPCLAEGNLMAPGCLRGNRARLTGAQVRIVRELAARGSPYRGGGPGS